MVGEELEGVEADSRAKVEGAAEDTEDELVQTGRRTEE
jgi:hypothetical protein